VIRIALPALALLLLCGGVRPSHGQDAAPESTADEAPSAPEDAPPEAGNGKAGHGSIEFHFGFYRNDDNGDGNPFLDEEETVLEPVLLATYNVTDTLTINGGLSLDHVTSASIERLSQYSEQSGASTDTYLGVDLGAKLQATEELSLGLRASVSNEYDYQSLGFGGDVSLDLFEGNTTISLGFNAFLDTVNVIRFNGSDDDGDESRTSISFNPQLYQILGPTIHLTLGYSFTHQTGFLETAFNGVVLEDPSDSPNPLLLDNARGVEIAEELPDTRLRHALYGRARMIFETGTAVELGLRLYSDSWGIASGTVELRLYQWIVDKTLSVRLRYRYYKQSAADDYEEHFNVRPTERAAFIASEDRTQDADLGDFSSNTVGIKLNWYVLQGDPVESLGLSFNVSFDYVLRSDGIDQILVAFGAKVDF
jgi:hypothetical protein